MASPAAENPAAPSPLQTQGQPRPGRRLTRKLMGLGASVLGAALAASVGWILTQDSLTAGSLEKRFPSRLVGLRVSLAEALARLSYDLPFTIRPPVETPGVCIVYIDEQAARALKQSPNAWDRALHTQLVRRLTAEGARAVFFDIVFADPSPDPEVDTSFAAAIQENGNVFLGAALEMASDATENNGTIAERVVPPARALRAAAAGWGLLAFHPVDSDYGVRRIYTGTETVPAATWRAAIRLGARLPDTPSERAVARWLNYYGRPRSFPSMGYDRALAADGVPPGFFKDRIVCIGGRSTLGVLAWGKDEFRNPYSLLGAEFSDGVEIHLTKLLNLLRGDWLRRLDARSELWLALASGLLLGGLLPLLRPHAAALAAFLGICAVAAFAFSQLHYGNTWFAWGIPIFVQAPLALVWAIGTRYFLEERRRNALRDAFGHFLPVQMVDRIAETDFDLKPGGSVVEASMFITDLEGFTPLAEKLDDPLLVSRVLIDYFSHTTAHILDNDGTIINFVADAVFAVWGAPLADDQQAQKATLAAWRLHHASVIEIQGRKLRTRIGLHSGPVLAGNIGSVERFDYAVVGDAVNFTSRLESLNKYLGTDILMSDAILKKVGDLFITREVGLFRVAGKTTEHKIHELLGPSESTLRPAWLDQFARGLRAFQCGNFDEACSAMQTVIDLRDGRDGPSQFYLNEIASMQTRGTPPGWSGIVELASK